MKAKPRLAEVKFDSDEEAERFLSEVDLTDYDLSGGVPLSQFEFLAKNGNVHFRLPQGQLEEIKAEAQKRGVPYQRFMRELLQRGMRSLDA
jgi:predicted DNA binding CopG/RHH family protein